MFCPTYRHFHFTIVRMDDCFTILNPIPKPFLSQPVLHLCRTSLIGSFEIVLMEFRRDFQFQNCLFFFLIDV